MTRFVPLLALLLILSSCDEASVELEVNQEDVTGIGFTVEAENTVASSSSSLDVNDGALYLSENQWASYEIEVPATGRYQVEVLLKGSEEAHIWIEDYINNTDDRTYNITGAIHPSSNEMFETVSKDGSPLKAGKHPIKIYAQGGELEIDKVIFTQIKAQTQTPSKLTQNMSGTEWKLVWSDEFEGNGLPDSTKWAYNIGNWGWGNNEPQYYTENRTENARQEGGNLIIEARKNDMGQDWTSARLTTQGKQSFLYGKIEFRAKVPAGRGTWAAGWLLGDDYEDELSWPYCGEIDVLECVGYEINDTTGKGLNHATCHTPKYYFKKGNQIGSQMEMENMNGEFHTYAIEWYPDVIYGLVDGERYYTYDKNADELEWPFHKPQNIIVNLAVGGGWGGAKGIDENWDRHQYILDYVRVYEKNETVE